MQAPAITGSKSVFLLEEKRAMGILQTNTSWVNTKCELSLSLSPPSPSNCTAKRKTPLASTSPHPPHHRSISVTRRLFRTVSKRRWWRLRRHDAHKASSSQSGKHIYTKKSLSLCSLLLFCYHHCHREIGFVQENAGTSYPPTQTTCRAQIPLSLLDIGEIHSELVKFASVLSPVAV